MSKQIKGLLYFYRADLTYSLIIFWSILFAMVTATVTLMHIFPTILMTFSFTGPVYVYCAIIAFLMARHTIAFGIKLGATRKNIYLSMGIFFVILALVKSTFASLVQEGVMTFLIRDDMEFYFIHPTFLFEDTMLNRIYTDFFIIIFLTAIVYVIALLFHKYGLLISGLMLGILFIAFTYSLVAGDLIKWIADSFQNSAYLFFAQLGLIGLLAYALAWLLLRKTTVYPKR